ncbi:MAG: DUF488 family protein [Xanthobacteraceae bacterium]
MPENATADQAAAFDLFTIGHSNHPIDRFLALLNGAGVTAIVDVRSQPSSRRYPWFSAGRLREALAGENISYEPWAPRWAGGRAILACTVTALPITRRWRGRPSSKPASTG